MCVPVQVDSLDEAIQLVNSNPYGNGTAIFTDSGSAARRFQHDVQVSCLASIQNVGPLFDIVGFGSPSGCCRSP